jgi:hypothetical protein
MNILEHNPWIIPLSVGIGVISILLSVTYAVKALKTTDDEKADDSLAKIHQ